MFGSGKLERPATLSDLDPYPESTTGAWLDSEMGRPAYGRLDAGTGGVARVTRGRMLAHGECSCGWKGSDHVLSAVAVHDALIHAAAQRCEVGVPLVS